MQWGTQTSEDGNSSSSLTGRWYFSNTGLIGMSSGDRHGITVSSTGVTSSFRKPARSNTRTNKKETLKAWKLLLNKLSLSYDAARNTRFKCNANGAAEPSESARRRTSPGINFRRWIVDVLLMSARNLNKSSSLSLSPSCKRTQTACLNHSPHQYTQGP